MHGLDSARSSRPKLRPTRLKLQAKIRTIWSETKLKPQTPAKVKSLLGRPGTEGDLNVKADAEVGVTKPRLKPSFWLQGPTEAKHWT